MQQTGDRRIFLTVPGCIQPLQLKQVVVLSSQPVTPKFSAALIFASQKSVLKRVS